MAAETLKGLCQFVGNTEEDNCGENPGGMASIGYFARKAWLKTIPEFKDIASEGALPEDAAEIDDTPGFEFKEGRAFVPFYFYPDSVEIAYSSNGDKAGFTQTLNASFLRTGKKSAVTARQFNNFIDGFFLFPRQGGNYQCFYDPFNNRKAESGALTGTSGKAPTDDHNANLSFTLNTVSPETFYSGTVTTTPATGS